MDAIKELFYGNILPFERDIPKDSEGGKLAKLTIRHENALRATLKVKWRHLKSIRMP